MNKAKARQLFNKANRLWFGEWFGEEPYNKVLSLYREALKHDTSDPVILYQLANVLWAFEQFDEVREVLFKIEQHQDRLSERGKEIFAEEKQRLLASPPFRHALPIPSAEIDLNKLESMNLSHNQWSKIAYAAEERGMFNLAEYALDRSMPFIDPDIETDRRKLRDQNESSLYDLEMVMSSEAKE